MRLQGDRSERRPENRFAQGYNKQRIGPPLVVDDSVNVPHDKFANTFIADTYVAARENDE